MIRFASTPEAKRDPASAPRKRDASIIKSSPAAQDRGKTMASTEATRAKP